MTEEEKTPVLTNIKSENSKWIKKRPKIQSDPEGDKKFDDMKRKYANAIAYLLVNNVPRKNMQQYFEASDDNKRRFATIKRLRQQIVDARPKARVWVDKGFYVKLDLGDQCVQDDGSIQVPIVLGECVFKQKTHVVASRKDLDSYMETIARIIDSEKVWADPDMADFDTGERDFLSETKK